jgi:hypothetical protein
MSFRDVVLLVRRAPSLWLVQRQPSMHGGLVDRCLRPFELLVLKSRRVGLVDAGLPASPPFGRARLRPSWIVLRVRRIARVRLVRHD